MTCTSPLQRVRFGPTAKPHKRWRSMFGTDWVGKGCSPCLFPVHRGLHVTPQFGCLTSFLTLRVSFFKHEGPTLESKEKTARKSLAPLAGSLRMAPLDEI